MRRYNPHPNDPDYDWGPADPVSNPVPADLVPYHREFKRGYWAYVCPCCHNVFAPGFAGMPEGFRSHIRPYNEGKGCMLNPSATPVHNRKHADKAANF